MVRNAQLHKFSNLRFQALRFSTENQRQEKTNAQEIDEMLKEAEKLAMENKDDPAIQLAYLQVHNSIHTQSLSKLHTSKI